MFEPLAEDRSVGLATGDITSVFASYNTINIYGWAIMGHKGKGSRRANSEIYKYVVTDLICW